MAGRINTGFVLILSGVLVVLVIGAAGLFMLVNESTEQLLEKGDAYMAEGRAEMAAAQYGSAAQKDPTNGVLVRKYVEALWGYHIEGVTEAKSHAQKLVQHSFQFASLMPQDEQAQEQAYQYIKDLYKPWYSANAAYSIIGNYARRNLESNPEDRVARRYLGIALVNTLTNNPSEAELDIATGFLQQAIAENPDDHEAIYAMARLHIFYSKLYAKQVGREDKVADHEARAVELATQQIEAKPEDVQRLIDFVRIVVSLREPRVEEAQAKVEQIERFLIADPKSIQAVSQAVRIFTTLDREFVPAADGLPATRRGYLRAQRLLQTAIEAHPDVLYYRYELGNHLYERGDLTNALEVFKSVRAAEPTGSVTYVMEAHTYGTQSASEIGNILFDQATASGVDDSTKTALLVQIDEIINELSPLVGEQAAALQVLKGKRAFAGGQYARALKNLVNASATYQESNVDVLELIARAHGQTGNWGAQINAYERILEINPGNVQTRLRLADTLMSNDQPVTAQMLLDPLYEQFPDNASIAIYAARAHSLADNGDRAIEIADQIGEPSSMSIAVNLAGVYQRQGMTDRALAILGAWLDKEPQSIRALQAYMQLTDDPGLIGARIEAAKQAGADPKKIDVLAKLADPEAQVKVSEFREAFVGDKPVDPLDQAIAQAYQAVRNGDEAALEAALEKASQINPDDGRLIEMQFRLALMREDMQKAEQLAVRAGELDSDLAKGAFFQGQLAMAKSDIQEAIAAYRRGLDRNPVYVNGWVMLAEALRDLGDYEGSGEAYVQALDLKPDDLTSLRGYAGVLLLQGKRASAIDTMRDAYRAAPNNRQLARVYLTFEQEYGEPQRALAIRQSILESNPDDMDNRRALALLLADLGRAEEAVEQLDLVVAEQGIDRVNAQALALMRLSLDDAEGGERVLQEYLVSRGSQAEEADYRMLAVFYSNQGRIDEAVAAYGKAIELEDSQEAGSTRALARMLFSRGQIPAAIRVFQELHRRFPDDTSIAFQLAQSLTRVGQIEQAEKILVEMTDDGSSNYALLRGVVARAKDEQDQALTFYNEALARDPNSASALVQRGDLLAQDADQMAAAANGLSQALEIDAQQHQARLRLAQIRALQGDDRGAERQLRVLVDNEPGHVPGRGGVGRFMV